MKKHKGINFHNKEEYIFCNFAAKTVDVIIEQKEMGVDTVNDYRLMLRHELENKMVTFIGFYKSDKIVIRVSGPNYEISDFDLPDEIMGFSKERIGEAINEYITRY